MRLRAGISAALASAAILLVGWQAGAHVAESNASAVTTSSAGTAGGTAPSTGSTANGTTGSSASGSSSGTGAGSSSGTGSTSGTGSSSSSTLGATAKAGGTYAGTAVETRFGTVQVQVTIKAGVITDVTALHLTDQEQRSVQISARAAPLLRSEVLSAQSANVQTIGGATFTSEAYLTSLQAALDAAHF
ncbi:FMN-binding protein [Arthrobacter sp. FW306-2-2C-D06B]|uniref:FMN-binding protein n=1 Tax=Arthrobacter sp. FW306-2-2C-D06B TaxID=2879618 RepID=UPI001F0162B6|nr:FMN-binding protein [Arthrobacter sp. FW306-2-2C-D06B]UKA58486.1 FMN-binding protein [Arthrobacter sp. FW306-2-2C-D06B]